MARETSWSAIRLSIWRGMARWVFLAASIAASRIGGGVCRTNGQADPEVVTFAIEVVTAVGLGN
jgi:hypothetical protein